MLAATDHKVHDSQPSSSATKSNGDTNTSTSNDLRPVPEGFQSEISSALLDVSAAGGGSGSRGWNSNFRRRTDWNGVASSDAMEKAIKEGRLASPSEWPNIARTFGIPLTTFKKRIKSEDPFATPKLGRPRKKPKEHVRYIADMIARHDELQNGLDVSAIIDALQRVYTDLTRSQCSNV